MVKTMPKPKKYTIEFLNRLILNYKAELIEKYDNNLTGMYKIKFKCSCGEPGEKVFRQIEKAGSYCKKCTKIKYIEKVKQTCREKYGVDYSLQSSLVIEKGKQTCREKYGVEYPLQSSEIREKMKQTNKKNLGVEYASQSSEIREKMKQTSRERYGVENPGQSSLVKEKVKQTSRERLGVDNPLQSGMIRKKIKQTCREKYGVENPMHNAEIAEKNSKNAYKNKIYTLPSGLEIKVQGYEPWALDELLKTYGEDELVIGDRTKVPEIWWIDSKEKRHRYYIDIYIPKENRLIEVKSTRTYKLDDKTEKIEKVPLACIAAGYKYEYWIYDEKGNKEVISEFTNKQPESIVELKYDPQEQIVNQI